jgi:hypothetical protein
MLQWGGESCRGEGGSNPRILPVLDQLFTGGADAGESGWLKDMQRPYPSLGHQEDSTSLPPYQTCVRCC